MSFDRKFIFSLPLARVSSPSFSRGKKIGAKAKIVCRICPSGAHLCLASSPCACARVSSLSSTRRRACASTDRFPVRAANSRLYRGNENSTVRWAVPTPQMYSVGGLTCIYESARVYVHTQETV